MMRVGNLVTARWLSGVQHQRGSESRFNMRVGNLLPARWLSTVQHQFANIQDPVQKALMAEQCILVDDQDNVVGSDSKLNCHIVHPDGSLKLHRAFSVLLFNSKGQLLMQQRSEHKVTFPHKWTNTCCSHPLFQDGETEGIDGVKLAATRRIDYEMGITGLEPKDLNYVTRIHYAALSNDMWGEHEIDYVLFAQKDLEFNFNKNEVSAAKYITLEEAKNMDYRNCTPWFKIFMETKLPIWWKSLDRIQEFRDHSVIHRL